MEAEGLAMGGWVLAHSCGKLNVSQYLESPLQQSKKFPGTISLYLPTIVHAAVP